VDRDRWGHLIILSSLASEKFPEMVIWVVDYNEGKRILEFDWH
jgi:hypothetical protein